MAQEELKFTIANNRQTSTPNDGAQVDAILTYNQNAPNADGSYTVTAVSGTYKTLSASGQVVDNDTITGVAQPDVNFPVDNELFVNSTPNTSPIFTLDGLGFNISNTADTQDGTGLVNVYDENGDTAGNKPTDTPSYQIDNTGNGNPATNLTVTPVCFTTGSLIRTTRGEIAVDQLAVGDLAITVSGDIRPITWIGHRVLSGQRDGAARALPFDQQPIRLRQGAFGAGLPNRDLLLSPGHPVLVGADADGKGGHLVPIMCLVNGTTIERVAVDNITYWHVELDGHDILLAEGLPAESYLDWGDRVFFSEAPAHALANPDFVVQGLNGRCRPVATDGPVVEAERRRLDAVFAAALTAQCVWGGTDDLSVAG